MRNNIHEEIKSKFLNLENYHCFSSIRFYEFFGFKNHYNFKRFLKSEKFIGEIYLWGFEKNNERKVDTFLFSRKLFLEICKLKHIDTNDFENYYVEYKEQIIKKKTSLFFNLKKASYLFGYEYFSPAGKYFNYSLNTMNLCEFIEIDHFDFIKYFCENASYSIDFFETNFKARNNFSNPCFPYYHFNSSNFNKRNNFLLLLKKIKEDFPLTELQKKLLNIYYKHIKIMLEKQTSFEMSAKEKKESYLKFKEKQKQNLKDPKVKDLYRKLSMMYHPDKNPEGEEIFKEINEAYKNNDIITLRKYLQ